MLTDDGEDSVVVEFNISFSMKRLRHADPVLGKVSKKKNQRIQ